MSELLPKVDGIVEAEAEQQGLGERRGRGLRKAK